MNVQVDQHLRETERKFIKTVSGSSAIVLWVKLAHEHLFKSQQLHFPIQFPVDAPEKAVGDGLSSCVPTIDNGEPGEASCLGQVRPCLLWPFWK